VDKSPIDRPELRCALWATGRDEAIHRGFVIFETDVCLSRFALLEVLVLQTIVYVDGYNLYCSLLRRSAYKWLDLFKLFDEYVLDKNEPDLLEVRFYTAPVLAKMSDDLASAQRQRIYWQALRKQCGARIKIIEGKMMLESKAQRLTNSVPGSGVLTAEVQVLSEKKTDVRLATDMLTDTLTNKVQQVVLCSNDSDFEPALAAIREHAPAVRIGLVAPVLAGGPRHMSKSLENYAHWSKRLSPVHLQAAQTPLKIPGTPLRCPETWRSNSMETKKP
jgi:uncharacterized LabA/DUF88 family protein